MDSVNPDPSNIPDDDLTLQNPQDDLDTTTSYDRVTHELTDDPTEELGVDPKEFKKELDHYAFEDSSGGQETDDEDNRREDIESRDMDPEESDSNNN